MHEPGAQLGSLKTVPEVTRKKRALTLSKSTKGSVTPSPLCRTEWKNEFSPAVSTVAPVLSRTATMLFLTRMIVLGPAAMDTSGLAGAYGSSSPAKLVRKTSPPDEEPVVWANPPTVKANATNPPTHR